MTDLAKLRELAAAGRLTVRFRERGDVDPAFDPNQLVSALFDALDAARGQEAALEHAYCERNRMVLLAAAIARHPFGLDGAQHPVRLWTDADEPDPRFATVVSIELPTGQVTFHTDETEPQWSARRHLGLHLGVPSWDGHDTDEKWRRVLAFLESQR
jgi:hypothetical protein